MMSDSKYISQIRAILKKTGWSQSRFAAELGATFATVNRWLNGHTAPQFSYLRHIERLYKDIVGQEPLPADELAKTLKAVDAWKRTIPDIRKIFDDQPAREDFILELTYHSDAIEGSTLSKKETEAVIFDKAMIKGKSLVEHLETVNHSLVLDAILHSRFQGPIDEKLIKEIHRDLLHGIRDDAGRYAKHHRAIRGVDLVLPAPQDIPEEMRELCSKMNRLKGHPIEHAAKMHADFEAIHPFGDGNGRVGRLLMIKQLLDCGYAPCVIAVNDKAHYYEALEYAQKRSPTHLIRFIAEAVVKGYELARKYRKGKTRRSL